MASSVRSCIFCGEKPVTQEHVFAEWIKAYIPTVHVQATNCTGTVKLKRGGVWIPKRERKGHKTGNPYSWKVKCVCGRCNSGWMSNDIQEAAKPFLIPLFRRSTHASQ